MSKTEFQHNIRLITKEKIEKPYALLFLRVVKETGPDSIHKPVQIHDEIGELKTINLRYYRSKKGHIYEIPLTRNLVPKEAEKIVIAWSQMYEEGDFVIDTSIPYVDTPQIEDNKTGIAKTNDNYEKLKAEAKEKHNRWIDEKVNDGWRFGANKSSKAKTHPMIKPWDELPEQYQEKFMVTEAAKFEKIEGYWITPKGELVEVYGAHASDIIEWAEENDKELYQKFKDIAYRYGKEDLYKVKEWPISDTAKENGYIRVLILNEKFHADIVKLVKPAASKLIDFSSQYKNSSFYLDDLNKDMNRSEFVRYVSRKPVNESHNKSIFGALCINNKKGEQ